MHSDGRIFVLETWAKRCQPSEMIREAFAMHERWQAAQWGIESVAYQKILKPIIETAAANRGIWVDVVELHPDSRTKKENRIRGKLEPYVQAGLIWMLESQEDLLQEMNDFPTGLTVDLLDAFAYGPDMWHKPLEGSDADDEKEERQFMWSPDRSNVTGY
jgi:predicted phage terminase large subunit-like protein